jgi:subtilisin family serine protease
MSLGGGASSALDSAVRNSIAGGVTYAVAAGNSNANACNSSPSRVLEALTVGSSTSSDTRSSFSNVGSCVDVFAPGSDITSAWNTSDTARDLLLLRERRLRLLADTAVEGADSLIGAEGRSGSRPRTRGA